MFAAVGVANANRAAACRVGAARVGRAHLMAPAAAGWLRLQRADGNWAKGRLNMATPGVRVRQEEPKSGECHVIFQVRQTLAFRGGSRRTTLSRGFEVAFTVSRQPRVDSELGCAADS